MGAHRAKLREARPPEELGEAAAAIDFGLGHTIHKSQGLTFPDGVVVDFRHAPNTKPVANVGLAFVAMSRATHWEKQAFRDLPDFWDFRKVLDQNLFKWRKDKEEHFDRLHDATMAKLLRRPFDAEVDFNCLLYTSPSPRD